MEKPRKQALSRDTQAFIAELTGILVALVICALALTCCTAAREPAPLPSSIHFRYLASDRSSFRSSTSGPSTFQGKGLRGPVVSDTSSPSSHPIPANATHWLWDCPDNPLGHRPRCVEVTACGTVLEHPLESCCLEALGSGGDWRGPSRRARECRGEF
jgi:hypothetical protein